MKYGVQIYTLRDELRDIDGVKTAFAYLRRIGIDCVELAAMPSDAADIDIKRAADNAGISIISSHNDFAAFKKDMESLIRTHFVYGTDIIGIGSMPGKYQNSLKGAEKFVRVFNKAADEAARYGMKLCYHNHAFEFKEQSGTTLFDYLLENLNQNVVFCIDCYWADYAGQDVAALLEKVDKRLALLHFKDSTGRDRGNKMCALGEGTLDFPQYINIAERLGVRCALIELDTSDHPREDLKRSAKYLESIQKEENGC